MVSPQHMDRMMDEHFRFEASDDVAGVLSTLDTDAVHDIVGFPTGPTVGREDARSFYEQMFADLQGGKVTPVKRYYGEDFLVDESVWEGTAPGKPFGLEGKGRPLSFRLLHLLEFTDEGKIKKEQVWLDLAAIIQQLSRP